MGEPLKGQVPDNIFLSIGQARIKGDVTAVAGDVVIPNPAAPAFWIKAATAAVLDNGFGVARVDIDTTGLSDGEVAVEVMTPPSKIYGQAGGIINPNGYVKLDASGQKWVAATETDLVAGTVGGRYEKVAGSTVDAPCALDDIIIIKTGVGA